MELTMREWQEKFNAGAFAAKDFETQCAAGWYDWFCKDESLAFKTQKLGNIIKKIKEGGKILDLDRVYVWFKNNCPCVGPLYDDFRISTKDGTNGFVVQICAPYEEETYTVYTPSDGYDKPVFKGNYSRELVEWFNTPADPVKDAWWFKDQKIFETRGAM